MMDFELEIADLYLSTQCNLRCKYCYISKNKVLFELDESVKENMLNGTILNNLKNVFVNKNNLKQINLWGAEPSLGFNEFSMVVHGILDEFPNLNKFTTSTNFTTDIKHTIGLLNKLNKYNRHIELHFQISIDGNKLINDFNRGIGVTEKIENNLKMLFEYYSNTELNNLEVNVVLKPTISIENIRQLTNRELGIKHGVESLFNYFNYFETLFTNYNKINKNKNIIFKNLPIMTLVTPSKYSSTDGKDFAFFVECLDTLEKKNVNENIFKYYKMINFFRKEVTESYKAFESGKGLGYCGIFCKKVAVLPIDGGYVSGCHRGYPDFFDAYIEASRLEDDLGDRKVISTTKALSQCIPNNYFYKIDNLDKMREKLKTIYESHNIGIASIAASIYECSLSGQADEIYSKDDRKLVEAAYIIRGSAPCLYDNMATTGEFLLKDYSKIRLFCNGAIEYILNNQSKTWE